MTIAEDVVALEWFRIDSFEQVDERDDVIARLVPGLRAAHALGAPVVWGIVSPGDGSGVTTWMAGIGAAADGTDRGSRLAALCLPPGALTTRFTSDEVSTLLATGEEWATLEAIPTAAAESIETDDLRGAILSQLADVPYACLISAEPATPEALEVELGALDRATRASQIEGRAEFASGRSSTDLSLERYRELVTARQLGGWSVRVFVGGRAGDTAVVSELVAAALDIPGLSFQRTGASSFTPTETWRTPKESFVASTRHLATLVRWPARELPGLVLRQQMPFDVNAEDNGPSGVRDVELGSALDYSLRPAGRFGISTSTLNRHALVCGATGSGKSQTVQQLLEELTSIGVPWLVIEPAKSEYREMRARLQASELDPSVHVIRLGDPEQPPLGLNPLEPAPGFPLQTHLDMVSALFVASFDAAEPFPQILAEALRRCYSDLGWRLGTGDYKHNELGRPALRGQRYPRYPMLSDLQRTARDVVYSVGYGAEVRDNVLGFVDVRLGSLRRGTPGKFFEGGHPLDLGALHSKNVVIEIEDVGNDLDKAFVIGTVILRLYEHLRVKGPTAEGGLTHVTVVEEAHRLLRRSEGEAKPNQAVELFGAMLSEVRAFGEGIVIAEQIPTKILPDVLKNTAVQVVHRLPSVEDRAILAGTTNMSDEQSAYVLSLRPGHAAAFREGMDAPVLLRVDYGGSPPPFKGTNPSFGELRERPRSVGCHGQCDGTPCSGRILEQSGLVGDGHPELPFWIELSLLSCVSGLPMPGTVETWVTRVRQRLSDTEVRACVVATLAEESVNARWAQVADFYDPTDLVRALVALASDRVFGSTPLDVPVGLAAGRFYPRAVNDALEAAKHSAVANPSTQAWRHDLGIDIPDRTGDQQLAWFQLSRHFLYAGHERLVKGVAPSAQSGPGSRLEMLARPLSKGATGMGAITAALEQAAILNDAWWPKLREWFDIPEETA